MRAVTVEYARAGFSRHNSRAALVLFLRPTDVFSGP
jgi:hypothetical protein